MYPSSLPQRAHLYPETLPVEGENTSTVVTVTQRSSSSSSPSSDLFNETSAMRVEQDNVEAHQADDEETACDHHMAVEGGIEKSTSLSVPVSPSANSSASTLSHTAGAAKHTNVTAPAHDNHSKCECTDSFVGGSDHKAEVTNANCDSLGELDMLSAADHRTDRNLSNCNIYIRNLDPMIDNNILARHFSACGKVLSTSVMRDIHSGRSLGSGFVRFSTHNEAKTAIIQLHNTLMNGARIAVQWAHKQNNVPVGEARHKIRKLFVRNVPFKVNKADLIELFSQFGDVLQVSIHHDTNKPLDRRQERNIAFVMYNVDGAADLAASKVHNTEPFTTCHGIPIMVKLAQNNYVKPERKVIQGRQSHEYDRDQSSYPLQKQSQGYITSSLQDRKALMSYYDGACNDTHPCYYYESSCAQCACNTDVNRTRFCCCDYRMNLQWSNNLSEVYGGLSRPIDAASPVMHHCNCAIPGCVRHESALPCDEYNMRQPWYNTNHLMNGAREFNTSAPTQPLGCSYDQTYTSMSSTNSHVNHYMNVSRRSQRLYTVKIPHPRCVGSPNDQHSCRHADELCTQPCEASQEMCACHSNYTSYCNLQHSSALQTALPCQSDDRVEDLSGTQSMSLSYTDDQSQNTESKTSRVIHVSINRPLSGRNSSLGQSFCTEVALDSHEDNIHQSPNVTHTNPDRGMSHAKKSLKDDPLSCHTSSMPIQASQMHMRHNASVSEYPVDYASTYAPETFSFRHVSIPNSSVASAYRHNPYSFVTSTTPDWEKDRNKMIYK